MGRLPRDRLHSGRVSRPQPTRLEHDRASAGAPELPASGIFDGELVAFGCDGLPSFPAVCQRVLHNDRTIALSYMVFDLLGLEGESTTQLPWSERRRLLEELDLNGRVGSRPTGSMMARRSLPS
jgi:ATP-dependent DNA ligase